MASDNKKKQVENFISFIRDNEDFFLIDFKKISHQGLEKLRRELRANNSRLIVVKNKLFQKAVNKLTQIKSELKEFTKKSFPLRGKTALIITKKDNWAQSLKVIENLIKKSKAVDFKQGLIEKNVYDQEKLLYLAKLPSKQMLLAKLIGQLKSPISSLVRSLKYNQNRFVFVLKRGGEKSK